MKQITAAIIEKDGKIFIAKRKKLDAFVGLWEFPGGKLEEGETLQECLKRELVEELGIVAEIAEHFYTVTFTHKETLCELIFFKVYTYTGEITLYDHSEMAWVAPEELSRYNFPEPDAPVIQLLYQKDVVV